MNKLFTFFVALLCATATFTACSNEDNSIVDKPTLGTDITWSITDGDANVPAGEKWIITGYGERTDKRIIIGDGATVTLSGVNIEAFTSEGDYAPSITCLGDATIILADRTTNILNGNTYPAIVVPTDKKVGTLTIKGTGSLEAKSSNAAGIGCPWNNENNLGVKMDCGNIVIESGNITAIGSHAAPGIGASGSNKCGDITIKGGNITATGGEAPGIGCCGVGGACGNILITGGIVTAAGGDSAPGIGSNHQGNCGSITITDKVTKVTASSTNYVRYSIGNNGDGDFHCGTITIGGTVYWDGSEFQNGGETYLSPNPFVYEP